MLLIIVKTKLVWQITDDSPNFPNFFCQTLPLYSTLRIYKKLFSLNSVALRGYLATVCIKAKLIVTCITQSEHEQSYNGV